MVGQSINLTATVTATGGGIPSAGSTVAFYDGDDITGTLLSTGTTNNAGKAIISTNALALGSHTINAYYNDTVDTNFGSSFGTLTGYSVGRDQSKVVVTASQATAAFGVPVNFTAGIVALPPGGASPADGEIVTFYDNSLANPIGTATTASGAATLTGVTLGAGSHTVIASYTGDTNLGPSNGSLANYAITVATTTTTVSASVPLNFPPTPPSFYGEPVDLTATVGVGSGNGPSGGSVTFKENGATLGTGTYTGTSGTLSTFVFATSATQLPKGTDQITAVYTPATNYGGSTSAPTPCKSMPPTPPWH